MNPKPSLSLKALFSGKGGGSKGPTPSKMCVGELRWSCQEMAKSYVHLWGVASGSNLPGGRANSFNNKNLQSLMIEESRDIWLLYVKIITDIYGCMYVYRYAVFVFLHLGWFGTWMKILVTFFQRKGITYTQYRTLLLLQLVLLKSGMSCHPSSIFHEWNTTLLKGLDRTRPPHPNIRGGRLDMNFSAKEDVKMTGRISKAPIYFESTGLISWGESVEWSSLGRMSVQMSKVKLNFITYTSLMSSFAQVQQWRSSLVAFDNHGNNGGLCNSLTNAAINASRWCFSNNHVFPFSHYFSPPVLEKKTPRF